MLSISISIIFYEKTFLNLSNIFFEYFQEDSDSSTNKIWAYNRTFFSFGQFGFLQFVTSTTSP